MDKQQQRGNVHRNFKKSLDFLLKQRLDFSDRNSFVRQFVSNDRYVEFFTNINESDIESVSIITGLAGCGKSCTIRYFLNFHKTVALNGENLIIPFAVDNMTDVDLLSEDWTDRISSSLIAAAELIDVGKFDHAQRAGLKALMTKSALFFQIKTNSDISDDIDFFSHFKEKHPVVYAVSVLKYRLMHSKLVRRVIFVLDDLESVDTEIALRLYRMIASVHTCINDHTYGRIMSVKTVVSCRHTTRDVFQRENKYNSFLNATTIEISPVKFIDIIKKRLDFTLYLASDINNWIRYFDENIRLDEFIQCVKFLQWFSDVLYNISRRDVFGSLYNQDIRLLMKVMLEATKYSIWFERRDIDSTPGSFKISEDTFHFSLNTTYRALYLQSKMNFRSVDAEIEPRFNFLYNWQDPMGDLLVPYISYYFYKKFRSSGTYVQIREDLLRKKLMNIFDDECLDIFFPLAIEYMRNTYAIFVDRRDDGNWLVSRPRLFATISQLGKSNILLGFFRDEIWRQKKSPIGNSGKFGTEMTEEELFWETLYIVDDVLKCERRIYEMIYFYDVGRRRLVNDSFIWGMNVSTLLLAGIENSRSAYFTGKNIDELKKAIADRLMLAKRI